MSESNKSVNYSFGLAVDCFIIFLVLKLTGAIDWSWWWVTSPLWIGFSFVFLILLVLIFITKGCEKYF